MNRRAFRLARQARFTGRSYNDAVRHTEKLDKNWRNYNESNIVSFQMALGMQDASIPEMTARIRRLRMRADSVERPGVN
jgi:hypothetical protein